MKIQELYTDSTKWTKGHFAKDSEECPCDANSSQAVCWCLSGALIKCYPNQDELVKVCNLIREKIGNDAIGIGSWNDSHTFEDVKKLVKELDI